MCGRFFVDARNREIERLLKALPQASPPVKLGEIYPTDMALVLEAENGEGMPCAMSWGFPLWNEKGIVFNARAESVAARPMFRKAFYEHPLAVPCSGFYEWKNVPAKKRKDKYLFYADTPLLYLAGFWNFFREDGKERRHFTILTTAANESMRQYHSRMPILLREQELPEWLSGCNRQFFLEREPFSVRAKNMSGFPDLFTSP